MINEIKNIKLSQLTEEEIEKRYIDELAKKEAKYMKLIEKQSKMTFDRDMSDLASQIETMKMMGNEQWIKDKIANSKTLKDMGLSFAEAVEILKENNCPLVLTEEDKAITVNETEFDDISDCVFVHRTEYLPKEGILKSGKDAGAQSYKSGYENVTINGEKYDVKTKSARETIHFSINGEVSQHCEGNSWDSMKYTIIIPGEAMREQNLAMLRPEDSAVRGSFKLPNGAILLVPESEREQVEKDIEGISVIGYEGTPKGYTEGLISSMGYKAENVSPHGLYNKEDQHKIYGIADKYGIPSRGYEHVNSLEHCEEERGEANNYIAEVFKIIKENKDKYIKEDFNHGSIDVNIEAALTASFYGGVSGEYKAHNDVSGIDSLLEKLASEGFYIDETEAEIIRMNTTKENMQQPGYKKILKDKIVYEVARGISRSMQQQEYTEEDKDILPSAIEATEETTRVEDVKSKGKELEQIVKDKQMTRENEERGIV